MAANDKLLTVEDGPWDGMLDSIAPTARKPGKCLLAQNIYPLDPAVGDGAVGRPGVRQLGATLGAVGARRGQGTWQFSKKDGTEYTVQITGGKIYTLNWGTEVWTNVVTAANLATAAITLDATAKIAFLTFNNKLLISDGINTPFLWDGTAGAGGLTKLVNCPVIYGVPKNYYARVFLISAANPTMLYWSNTDDATTGYAAFGNSWDLTQTDPNRLHSIEATNDGVYAVRARSGTVLGGVPSSNFSSSASRDSLSDSYGTMSPWATILQDVNLVVLDSDMHPQFLRPGGAGFTPLWTPFRETLKSVPKTPAMLAKCMSVIYTPASLMLMAVPDVGATECTMLLVYDLKGPTPVAVAVWRGWEMTTLAMVKDGNGIPYLLHSDTTGAVYLHGNPEDQTPWDDFLASGTAAVDHILETQPLGYSKSREKIFDRIDVGVRSTSTQTLEISCITSRGTTQTTQSIVVQSGLPGYDTGVYDTVVYDPGSVLTQEAHGDVGIDEEARWLKVRIRHRTVGEQFGLVGLSVYAFGEDDDPEVP